MNDMIPGCLTLDGQDFHFEISVKEFEDSFSNGRNLVIEKLEPIIDEFSEEFRKLPQLEYDLINFEDHVICSLIFDGIRQGINFPRAMCSKYLIEVDQNIIKEMMSGIVASYFDGHIFEIKNPNA